MTYDELTAEANSYNLKIVELPLQANKGRIIEKNIAIREDIPTIREKACVLAEELGHYHTTVGNIMDQQETRNRKQELRARLWAYDKQVGLLGIIDAYKYGCRTVYDMADHLDITEDFLRDALRCYRSKYGERAVIDNYIIYFEPNLGVMEMI